MEIKTNSLDELENQLKQFQKNAEKSVSPGLVAFNELFAPEFMRQYTSFDTIDDLFKIGGFDINSSDDLEAIPDDILDEHISKHTSFSSWEDMYDTASSEYVARKLDF